MTGFYISNWKGIPVSFSKETTDITEQLPHETYEIARKTNDKFLRDKVFCEDADYIFVLEGVIYNDAILQKKYQCSTMPQLLHTMAAQKGETFHSELIGNFAGAFLDKKQDTWYVFANKYASKEMFYYFDGKHFIVAPLPIQICHTLQAQNIPYHFNNDAAYLMMTYGYMGTDDTFVKEIKKIEAGCYLKLGPNGHQSIRYHRFTNHAYDLSQASEEEIIAGIDRRFRQAIRLEYEKDRQYGYSVHLRTLTGGTDSRACAFVSDSLGYKNVVNLTTGQPDYADEQIAREISLYLKNKIIFMSTDTPGEDHDFLRLIDQSIYCGQGLSYYMEASSSLKKSIALDAKSYGLSHGGAFSEAFLTTGYLKDPKEAPPARPLHIYSSLLLDKCPKDHLKQYETEDIYSLYSIFFHKHNPQRNLTAADCCLAYPGLYPDLVEYCLSIPVSLRKGHYIYHKWLFTKYPAAKQFKLEKLNARYNDTRLQKWCGKMMRYGSPAQYLRCSKDPLPTKLRHRFQLDEKIKASRMALMPFDYWYQTDTKSRQYMDRYFAENLKNPVLDEQLRQDLRYVYENSQARPKSMAITVVGAAKLFFGGKDTWNQ